jgi:transketolase
MRNAFAAAMTELAGADERVVLLSGDIGNRLFDKYKAAYPERFLNCGVAEANMIGLGAGMAMSGLRPVAYTITPFVTTRCLEQIRVDVAYQDVPVVIAGVGAGLSYASLGGTHHSCEDISFLRSIPGMTVVCPGDAHEVTVALRAAVAHDGPVYLRLGKKGEPLVHEAPPEDFRIGEGLVIRNGDDVCLLSTGNLLPLAVEAAEVLEARGITTTLVSFHTVKPLDTTLLDDAFASHSVVATIEEHSVVGGLGSAVAEWAVDSGAARDGAQLLRIGTPDKFLHESGGQGYARERSGLTVDSIAARVVAAQEGAASVAR